MHQDFIEGAQHLSAYPPKRDEEDKQRAVPCRWTHSEHQTLVVLLKKREKSWKEIAEIIGTKNEQ